MSNRAKFDTLRAKYLDKQAAIVAGFESQAEREGTLKPGDRYTRIDKSLDPKLTTSYEATWTGLRSIRVDNGRVADTGTLLA